MCRFRSCPEVLQAKVRVFSDLYRKTRELENLNAELEKRVAERTAELEESTAQLRESEQRRSLALAAGQMGGWDWDRVNNLYFWDEGQKRIFGVAMDFSVTAENIRVPDLSGRFGRARSGLGQSAQQRSAVPD